MSTMIKTEGDTWNNVQRCIKQVEGGIHYNATLRQMKFKARALRGIKGLFTLIKNML